MCLIYYHFTYFSTNGVICKALNQHVIDLDNKLQPE